MHSVKILPYTRNESVGAGAYTLVLFKAQLGEPLLENLFISLFKVVVSSFFGQNQHLSVKTGT